MHRWYSHNGFLWTWITALVLNGMIMIIIIFQSLQGRPPLQKLGGHWHPYFYSTGAITWIIHFAQKPSEFSNIQIHSFTPCTYSHSLRFRQCNSSIHDFITHCARFPVRTTARHTVQHVVLLMSVYQYT